jgi:hypothetical protein
MLKELEFLAYPEHVSATLVSALLVATSKENLQTINLEYYFNAQNSYF